MFERRPDHPGVAHYLIHAYDYTAIVEKALPAARRYACIAPSAPHALHMPAHIFTRLGLWEDSIDTNSASARAARAEIKSASLSLGSYNALHATDCMMYAYLQRSQDRAAQQLMDEVSAMQKLDAANFAAACALAAMPARLAAALVEFSRETATEPNRDRAIANATRAADLSGERHASRARRSTDATDREARYRTTGVGAGQDAAKYVGRAPEDVLLLGNMGTVGTVSALPTGKFCGSARNALLTQIKLRSSPWHYSLEGKVNRRLQ